MKKLLVLVFLLSQFNANCQFWRGLSIGPASSTESCYRILKTDNAAFLEDKNASEKPGSGFQAGLMLMKPVSQHISLESGFYFRNHTYGTEKETYTSSMLDVNQLSKQRTFKFLSLPVGMRYYFNGDRISFFMGGTLTPSLLTAIIDKDNYYKDDRLSVKAYWYEDIQDNFNLSAQAFLGTSIFFSYYSSARLDIAFIYNHSVTSIKTKDTIEYPTSLGFKIGIASAL